MKHAPIFPHFHIQMAVMKRGDMKVVRCIYSQHVVGLGRWSSITTRCAGQGALPVTNPSPLVIPGLYVLRTPMPYHDALRYKDELAVSTKGKEDICYNGHFYRVIYDFQKFPVNLSADGSSGDSIDLRCKSSAIEANLILKYTLFFQNIIFYAITLPVEVKNTIIVRVGIADTHVKTALTGNEEEEFGAVQELFMSNLNTDNPLDYLPNMTGDNPLSIEDQVFAFTIKVFIMCNPSSCANAASGVLPEVAPVCLAWVGASSDAAVQRDVSASLEERLRLGTQA
ncbi:hypothetical protein Q9233_005412 [Columba guinea]|nr:hypothetical protein Q9233_005412 [Columba guinea]